MQITYFFALVCLSGLLASQSTVLPWQIVWGLFGSSAAAIVTALGGASITPAVLFVPFMLARACAERNFGGLLRQLSLPGSGFWLGLLVAWGVFTAFVFPRVFAGTVHIFNIDRLVDPDFPRLYPLRPASGNITQSGYALVGLFAFVAARSLLARPGRTAVLCNAMLLAGGLNIAAAIIDLAQAYLHLPNVLDYVRNGSYAITNQYISGGVKRVAGTFAEPSSFAGFTLPSFAFSFSLWLSKFRTPVSGWIAFGSLLFLVLSTSTTAYVGLMLYAGCLFFMLIRSAFRRGGVPRLKQMIVLGAAGLLIISVVVLTNHTARQIGHDILDQIIFKKLESDSGVERGAWNRHAWRTFLDSYCLGAGLGSARASSYPLVILANLGLPGAILLSLFLIRTLRGIRASVDAPFAVQNASKHAVVAILIPACISATVFDLGVTFYCLAAAATLAVANTNSSVSRRRDATDQIAEQK